MAKSTIIACLFVSALACGGNISPVNGWCCKNSATTFIAPQINGNSCSCPGDVCVKDGSSAGSTSNVAPVAPVAPAGYVSPAAAAAMPYGMPANMGIPTNMGIPAGPGSMGIPSGVLPRKLYQKYGADCDCDGENSGYGYQKLGLP